MIWFLLIPLLCFFLSPIVGILHEINGEMVQEVIASSAFMKSLKDTVISSFLGSLISLLVGLFFARQLALYQWKLKRLFRLSLMIPYLIPNFVLTSGYILGWNPTSGLLRRVLPFPGGLYGLWGIILLFGVAHMPISLLLIEEKLKRIDPSLREASQISGASRFQTFIKIDLPLLMPTLLVCVLLGFALNSSAFAIPAWIGAPEKVYPLTYKIYQAIQTGGLSGISKAAVYALFLLALTISLLFIQSFFIKGDKKYVTVSGKGVRNEAQAISFWKSAVINGMAFLYNMLVWALPLGILLCSTLVPPGCLQEQGFSCFNSWSLRNYIYVLFHLQETKEAFYGSFVIGGLSALSLSVISMFFLIMTAQRRNLIKILESALQIPVSTPGAVLALGLIVVGSGRYGINIYNTTFIVALAFWMKHGNLAFQPLRTGFLNISTSLSEAARMSGAKTFEVWRSILIPILKSEWIGGFFLVFIPILGELTMSVFLAGPNFKSIGTLMFDLQDYADQAAAQALGIILIISILIFNEAARRLSRGQLGY